MGKTTYNTQPYFKIVVSAEPDGQTQEIQLSVMVVATHP